MAIQKKEYRTRESPIPIVVWSVTPSRSGVASANLIDRPARAIKSKATSFQKPKTLRRMMIAVAAKNSVTLAPPRVWHRHDTPVLAVRKD